jgi:hypothetical protein
VPVSAEGHRRHRGVVASLSDPQPARIDVEQANRAVEPGEGDQSESRIQGGDAAGDREAALRLQR